MNVSTTLQNEAACPTSEFLEGTFPEEDEMVCLDTIPGVSFLTPPQGPKPETKDA